MEPSFIILDLERHHAGWRRWVWIRRRQLRPDVARSLHGRGRWRALSAVSYLTVPTTIVVGPKPELVDDLEQLHESEAEGTVSHQAQPRPSRNDFPRAHKWAAAAGDLLLPGDGERERWWD
jgi:hypothetical protein